MISDSTHPKTRVSNTQRCGMSIAERKARVLDLAAHGEQPKNIAVEVGFHYASVRKMLRDYGFGAMIVSPEERKLIESRRARPTVGEWASA